MSVPLSTIKAALKIDYDTDDTDLIRLREVATKVIEQRTQIRLQPATELLYLSSFHSALLPVHPFVEVKYVTYQDASNATVSMPSSDYYIDRTDGPIPMIGFLDFPAIYEGTAITVAYTAGFESIPDPLVHCIISLTGAMYNNPEAVQPISLSTVPLSVQFILDQYSTRSHIR